MFNFSALNESTRFTPAMKTIRIFALICFCFAGVGRLAAQPGVSISFATFYNELSPYGEWIQNPQYGQVWVPNAGPDFQPYGTAGHWEMTEYGNTWVSDYPWGWAPFHYGRWQMDPYRGWVWVPDYEWGPAWVGWRNGGGYYGWAPLGPGMNISVNINLPWNYWTFVPQRYILSPRIYSYCVPRTQVVNIYHNTTIINNVYRYNNRSYAAGPRAYDIQRATGRNVDVRRADDFGRRAGFYDRGSMSGRNDRFDRNQGQWNGNNPGRNSDNRPGNWNNGNSNTTDSRPTPDRSNPNVYRRGNSDYNASFDANNRPKRETGTSQENGTNPWNANRNGDRGTDPTNSFGNGRPNREGSNPWNSDRTAVPNPQPSRESNPFGGSRPDREASNPWNSGRTTMPNNQPNRESNPFGGSRPERSAPNRESFPDFRSNRQSPMNSPSEGRSWGGGMRQSSPEGQGGGFSRGGGNSMSQQAPAQPQPGGGGGGMRSRGSRN